MVDQDPSAPSPDDSANDEEFHLQPAVERSAQMATPKLAGRAQSVSHGVRYADASRYRRNPHASLYATDTSVSRPIVATAEAREGDRSSAGPAAMLRNDATINLWQKHMRFCGYTTLVFGLTFLVLRFIYFMFFTGENMGLKFADFLSYSFWVAAGTAFMSTTFFASAEFFQLLIDVQSNTFARLKTHATDNESLLGDDVVR